MKLLPLTHWWPKLAAIVLVSVSSAWGQLREPAPTPAGDFEEPPVLAASAILRPEFLKGPHHTLRNEVPTMAGHNQYVIESEFGIFEADGNAALVDRVAEVEAIAKLRAVSRTEVYEAALKKAAKSPVAFAKSLAHNPVKTVSGVPKGLWKFMNRTGQSLKEVGEERERPGDGSGAKDLIGFSKVKRELATKLGVDPYSSNATLQKELNGIGWAAYGGSMTISVALAPVGGGAGTAITAFNVADASTKALTDESPNDLRRLALSKLLAMGIERANVVAFLNNTAYSPTHQTRLVLALESLQGATGRSAFLELAGEAADETDALFFQRCAQVMVAIHRDTPLASMGSFNNLPLCITKGGIAIVPLEWDYASWTENAARYLQQLKTVKLGDYQVTGYRVVLTGLASPRVKEELAKLDVQLVEKALPGPLK